MLSDPTYRRCLYRRPYHCCTDRFAAKASVQCHNTAIAPTALGFLPGRLFFQQKQTAIRVSRYFLKSPNDIHLHRRIAAAAFVAWFLLVGIPGGYDHSYAGGGQALNMKIAVSARVLERTTMKVLHQKEKVVVTSQDILQGYLDVPVASSIAVRSNNPRGYLLLLEILSDAARYFDTVIARVNGKEVQLLTNGGYVTQPFVRGEAKTEISYRFVLSKDAQPGTYRWPLAVSVSSR